MCLSYHFNGKTIVLHLMATKWHFTAAKPHLMANYVCIHFYLNATFK